MAKVPINDPKHWRERAEGARTLADQMEDQDARRNMLRIADDYEESSVKNSKAIEWAG